MTEKKEKELGIVMRGPKTSKQKEEKKFYTIVSCCVGAVFLLTIFVPLLAKSDKGAADLYRNYNAYDLVDLATDDEAERVLLEMNEYSDIPGAHITSTLFSQEDKEDRQADDEEYGTPGAPDEEYQEGLAKKELKRRAASNFRAQRNSGGGRTTTPGKLSTGNSISSRGGGGGLPATNTWTSDDKKKQEAGKRNNNFTENAKKELTASVPKGRSQNTFLKSITESKDAANSKEFGASAQKAADAFTNQNIGAEGDDLKDGIDILGDKFNEDALKGALNDDALTDLENKINEEKDKAEKEEDPCKSKDRATRLACKGEEMAEKLLDKFLDLAFKLVENAADKEKLSKDEKNQQKIDELMKKYMNSTNERQKERLKRRIERRGGSVFGGTFGGSSGSGYDYVGEDPTEHTV